MELEGEEAVIVNSDIPERHVIRILIDTNVFIALEEAGGMVDIHSEDAARFSRLAAELGAVLVVSKATELELQGSSRDRKRQRINQLSKYSVLERIPRSEDLARRAGFPEHMNSNDERDLEILGALDAEAASWLVTQDTRLRKRAEHAGLGERVLSLLGAIEQLSILLGDSLNVPVVRIERGYTISLDAEIFSTVRHDYPDLDQWWRSKVAAQHRHVLIIGQPEEPEALAALKCETNQPHNIAGKVLKVSTFVTHEAYQGLRRGELLLSEIIEYARAHAFHSIYLEVLPHKEFFLSWLHSFGFMVHKEHATNRDETVLLKHLIPPDIHETLSALEFNVRYGPGAQRVQSPLLVPIKPRFHQRLFSAGETQLFLLPAGEPCGNGIRKAYLCNAKIRNINEGDTLIFVRTGKNAQATVAGVVERTVVTSDPYELVNVVGNRTVYSIREMESLCNTGAVLAVLFRFDRFLRPSWTLKELREAAVLRGSPQSIQRVRPEGIEWLRNRLENQF